MLRFVFTRLSLLVPTFFGMTLLAFFLIRALYPDLTPDEAAGAVLPSSS